MTDFNPKKITLPSGLRIVTVPQKETGAATVLVLVQTGSKYETKEQNGISHFLEHMFFKGTKKRPSTLEIAEPIDAVGGTFNAFTSEELTGYWIKVEYDDLPLALDFVSDIFFNSIFPAKEIAKEKGAVIEEINIYNDNPMRKAEILWREVLYGDQPAGWNVAGSKETVLNLTRQGMISYMKRQYIASRTVVCVAGNIDEEDTQKRAASLFSKTSQEMFKDRKPVYESQKKPEILLEWRGIDQARIALGVRAYNMFHPARFTQGLLATILGGMMSSRLFIEVRDKLGLAYDVGMTSEEDPDSGFLLTRAGVTMSNAEKAIRTILHEYKKIVRFPVPVKELKKAKEHIKGQMALNLEASDEKASFYGIQELLEHRVLTPAQVYDKIKSVRASDIKRVAQELFVNNRLNLVLVGPFSSRGGSAAGGKEKKQFEKLLRL
ncbi:MAG: hypothetical protein Greene101447_562 [Parcubacteria group bacterium Greene1014_47]|nr:MAG: hypothetical protein Greene101447_562 [Parcubacteria group bacterium Greene1014_47]